MLTCFIRDSIPPASVHWSISKENITVPTNQIARTHSSATIGNAIDESSANQDRRLNKSSTTRNKQDTLLDNRKESLQRDVTGMASVTVKNNRAGKFDVMSQLLLPVDGRDDNKRVTCNAIHSEPVPIASHSTQHVLLQIRCKSIYKYLYMT